MRTIECNVDRRAISFDSMSILQGGVGVDAIHVVFDDEWDGFGKRCVFENGSLSVSVSVGSDGTVAVPGEVLEPTGNLYVSFVGTRDGRQRITTKRERAYLTVARAGAIEGTAPGEPTVGDLEKARQQAVEAADAASDATDAANRAKADADSATRAAQDATAAASRAADSANGAASAATASKDAADVATGDARAATRAANDAAQAALSAVTADRKVWLDYDEDGYLSIYEVRS